MLLFVPSPLSFVTGLTDDALDASRSRECESGGLALWTRGPLLAGSILLVLGFAVPFLVLGSAVSLSTSVLESFSAAQLEIAYGIIVLGVLQARGRQAREVRIMIASRPAALKARRSTDHTQRRLDPVARTGRGTIMTLSGSVPGGASRRGASSTSCTRLAPD